MPETSTAPLGEAAESGSESTATRPRLWRRLWRVGRWILLGLTTLLVLAVLAVWLVLANVNHPAIKSRVQALVKSSAGLDIDYDGLSISLRHGITAERISIASPAALAEHAPSFVTIDDLDVKTRLWTLPFRDIAVDAITVGSIDVNMVVTGSGDTTLTLLFPPSDKPEKKEPDKPSTPRSELLATLPSIAAGHVSIGNISAALIELDDAGVVRRSQLSGLSIEGALRTGSSGLDGTEITIAAPRERGGLSVATETRIESRAGRFHLALSAIGRGERALTLTAALSVIEQGLVTTTRPVTDLLDLAIDVDLEPDKSRTSIRVARLAVLDKAVSAELSATIPDGDGSLSASADGQIHVRLPSLPVNVPGVAIDELSLDVVLEKLAYADAHASGTATVNGTIGAFAFTRPDTRARLSEVVIEGTGTLDTDATASLTVTATEIGAAAGDTALESSALSIAATGAIEDVTGEQRSRGTVELGAASTRIEASDSRATVSKLALTVVARRWLGVFTDEPMSVSLTGKAAAVDAAAPGDAVVVGDLVVGATGTDLRLDDRARVGVTGSADAALTLGRLRGRVGARTIAGRSVALDVAAPLSLARARASVRAAGLTVAERGGAPIAATALDLKLVTTAPLELAPGDPGQGTLDLTGAGRVSVGKNHGGAISGLKVHVDKTAAAAYATTVNANASGVIVSGAALDGRVGLALEASADLDKPAIKLDMTASGPGGARVVADVRAVFVRRGSRLVYSADISARSLEAIGKPLEAVAASSASVALAGASLSIVASGDLGGVLVARRGEMPSLAPDPLGTIRGGQSVQVTARGVDYKTPELAVKAPTFNLLAKSTHDTGGVTDATATIDSGQLTVILGSDRIVLHKLSETVTLRSDAPLTSSIARLTTRTRLASAVQPYFADYEVRDLSLDASIEIDRLRSAFVRELELDNPAAGTRLELVAALERSSTASGLIIPGREAMTLEGTLTQSVAPLDRWGVAKKARGTIKVPFHIESGDLLSYRVQAKIIADHVSLTAGGVSLTDVNGVIPVVEEVALLPTGLVVLPGPRTNVLSRTRFFDVHPFLDSEDYVTAKRVEVAGQRFGPIAGNVRVARSAFSIDQLQVGYRSGTIIGQVRADYRDGDPRISARLNITGVKPSSSGAVLDANAAIDFIPRSLALAGKIQIVRIGKDHLLEILDILDPYRETVNVNKVRLGLKVGYPKFVRLVMADGALDAKVELGGVGKLVRIDEIRSIPLGPILQTYVAPIVDALLPRRPRRAVKESR